MGSKEKTTPQSRDFVAAVIEWLSGHGAEPTAPPCSYGYCLETRAGRLLLEGVEAHENSFGTVFTRFVDPEAAVDLLGEGHVNPYSGKWNHYYFKLEGITSEGAFDDVIGRLTAVLPIIGK